jgi:hypothetical protein
MADDLTAPAAPGAAQPAAAAAQPALSAPPSATDVRDVAIEQAVATWAAGLRNTALSRETSAWNVFQEALPRLTAQLKEL